MKCVCGHSAYGHHAWTGVCCNGDLRYCTCVEFQPDDGTVENPQAVCYPKLGNHQPYTGKYGRHQ